MKLRINCETCDARRINEENYREFEQIKIYTEKPSVEFDDDFIVAVVSEDGNNVSRSGYYTSKDFVNEEYEELCNNDTDFDYCLTLLSPSFSYSKLQSSFDNKNDKLFFTVKFSQDSQMSLQNIKIFLFLKYAVRDKAKYLFYPLVPINIDIPTKNTTGALISLIGELKLKQKSPIYAHSISPIDEHKSPFNLNSTLDSPFDLLKIYDRYMSKNITVSFDYEEFIEPNKYSIDESRINIEIYIPQMQEILYHQNLFDTVKNAWIQYIFILIPIAIIVYYLLVFILGNHVFDCYTNSEIRKKTK